MPRFNLPLALQQWQDLSESVFNPTRPNTGSGLLDTLLKAIVPQSPMAGLEATVMPQQIAAPVANPLAAGATGSSRALYNLMKQKMPKFADALEQIPQEIRLLIGIPEGGIPVRGQGMVSPGYFASGSPSTLGLQAPTARGSTIALNPMTTLERGYLPPEFTKKGYGVVTRSGAPITKPGLYPLEAVGESMEGVLRHEGGHGLIDALGLTKAENIDKLNKIADWARASLPEHRMAKNFSAYMGQPARQAEEDIVRLLAFQGDPAMAALYPKNPTTLKASEQLLDALMTMIPKK